MIIADRKLLPLLLIAALALGISSGIRPAHAAGTLYTLPLSQAAFPAGSTFNVKIQVANIDPFNAWDISVQTDNTVISPQSLTITGNLLAANFSTTVFELINCVNGAGKGCIATDGPGIAHSSVTGFGPPPQFGPSSGLLFTITYKVIATSLSASSTIHFFNDLIVNPAVNIAHTTVDGFYGGVAIHALSVTAVTPSATSVAQGTIVTLTVTVKNTGGLPESGIAVSGLVNGLTAGTTTIASLGVGASTTVPVAWDTTTFAPATYTIGANAADSSTTSTIFTDGTVTVTPLHDCHFVHGKLSWTHHLSLAKNPTGQTFTAHVRCDTIDFEFIQVTVSGSSSAGVFTAISAPKQLTPGVLTDIAFSQAVPTNFVGTKICFTASVSWGGTAATVTANLSPVQKSGCFAVLP